MLNGVFNSSFETHLHQGGVAKLPLRLYNCTSAQEVFGCRGNSDVQSCSQIHVAEMSRCAAVSPGLGKLQDALKYWGTRGKLPATFLLFCSYYYLAELLCASVRLPFMKQTSQR